jgi:hypothetical protein
MINFKEVVADYDNSRLCVVPFYDYDAEGRLLDDMMYFNERTMLRYETLEGYNVVTKESVGVECDVKLDEYVPIWGLISDKWFAGSLKYGYISGFEDGLNGSFYTPSNSYGICVRLLCSAMEQVGCNAELLTKLRSGELTTVYIQILVEYEQ